MHGDRGMPVGTASATPTAAGTGCANSAREAPARQGRDRDDPPHRDPFLLLDDVTELQPGGRVVAHKLVAEEDCAGHFPGN